MNKQTTDGFIVGSELEVYYWPSSFKNFTDEILYLFKYPPMMIEIVCKNPHLRIEKRQVDRRNMYYFCDNAMQKQGLCDLNYDH